MRFALPETGSTTMPTDPRRAFLAAIYANPDEDTHRLVFADWLDENGDPDRAEFIRAQCELSALPPGDPRRVPLGLREVVLRQRHAHEWVEELPKWARAHSVRFRRGMPARIECTKKEFLRNASALAKRTAVDGVRFKLSDGTLSALAELPQLARLREVTLGTSPPLDDQHKFLASPALTGLQRLDLFLSTDDDLQPGTTLIRLPAVQALRELDIMWITGGDARPHWREFFVCEFPALRSLTFNGGIETTTGVRAMLGAPFLPRLEAFDVLTDLTPKHADLWSAASDRMAGLRLLDIATGDNSDYPRLLRGLRVPGVRDLRLDHANDETARALVKSPLAGQLTRLSLRHHKLTRAGVAELASSGVLANLLRLSLAYGPIDDDAVRALAAGKGLRNLQDLDLDGTRVTLAGLEALARSPHLPALSALNVTWSLDPKDNRDTAALASKLGARIVIFHDNFHHE
jgi:uncharacterized protein (TIGR02996 family)